jgi:hypothetical protein
VEQFAAERIDLPIFQDGGLVFAGEVHLEKSVVAAGGAENRSNLLGVQRERDGIAFAAVENGRNFAGLTQAASLVLAPIGAGRSFNNDLSLSHTFFPSLNSCGAGLR